MALRRLYKERQTGSPPPGYASCGPVSDDLFKWTGSIEGPPNTAYDGGWFHLDINIPQDYPFKPPKVKFTTKIYHCNINDKGGISLDVLKDKWSPAYDIYKVLLSIRSLLEKPNADDPLVPKIAHLYKTNKRLHDIKANEYAHKHAGAEIQMSTIEYRMEQMKRYKVIKTCLMEMFGITEDIQMVIIAMDGQHLDKLPKLKRKALAINMSTYAIGNTMQYRRELLLKMHRIYEINGICDGNVMIKAFQQLEQDINRLKRHKMKSRVYKVTGVVTLAGLIFMSYKYKKLSGKFAKVIIEKEEVSAQLGKIILNYGPMISEIFSKMGD